MFFEGFTIFEGFLYYCSDVKDSNSEIDDALDNDLEEV